MSNSASTQSIDIGQKAQSMWDSLDEDEKTCVRFGMIPLHRAEQAESEGLDLHDMTVALFNCAKKYGGMRA